MSALNWITKDKQKEYVMGIEKQLLLASVQIVTLQEELAHYVAAVSNQAEVIKELMNHINSDDQPNNKTTGNVIFLKPRRRPKK